MFLNIFQQQLAGIPVTEVIGYFASLLILIGMTMSSVRKLRWINLGGNILFALYGLLIGSLPVALMNAMIGVVNTYFLTRLYSKKESFKLLPVLISNRYLKAFIDFHQADIEHFFPGFRFNPDIHNRAYIVLRDMTVAAVIVGIAEENTCLKIELDYAITAYRDMKPGNFAYGSKTAGLASEGFTTVRASALTKAHEKYLKLCGFRHEADLMWYRNLE